jgi:hypothetical protein
MFICSAVAPAIASVDKAAARVPPEKLVQMRIPNKAAMTANTAVPPNKARICAVVQLSLVSIWCIAARILVRSNLNRFSSFISPFSSKRCIAALFLANSSRSTFNVVALSAGVTTLLFRGFTTFVACALVAFGLLIR